MAVTLDCNACKTQNTMKAATVARFNGIIRTIGVLIVVPSLIGVALSFATCFATSEVANATIEAAQSDAETAGATIGAGISYGISFFFGAASLVGGLIGWLCLLKRKVFKCGRCGFVLDRA